MMLNGFLVLFSLTNVALTLPMQGIKPVARTVSQAAENLASDANAVSDAITKLPTLSTKEDIQSVSQVAIDAESDEDTHRIILATAASCKGNEANEKLLTYGPTVLRELKAMNSAGTPEAVKQSIPVIEKVRNPNVLPSITQLSNAALENSGLPPTQKDFPPTGVTA
ncbi:unnamed protein product [Blumeria hordei]|uniref:Uncharacterized protein n=1 Tax=Blumeria hordei TaxID=2867405 RepID=A0A383UQG8_BLUHO|nr:unnamed protein product [Blumeria hordei]